MTQNSLSQHLAAAQAALASRDWARVAALAKEIKRIQPSHPDGSYLQALAKSAMGQRGAAITAYKRCLTLAPNRYDAGIELAALLWAEGQHEDALKWLQQFSEQLADSPKYLFRAADIYTKLGLHQRAWPLYQRADALQPGIDALQAALASCATKIGELELARDLYEARLAEHPEHQRNHYELSRLLTAKDDAHVRQMLSVLTSNKQAPEDNIFLYYALGKELEDLQRWDDAFDFYQRGGEAAAKQCAAAGYRASDDVALMEQIIECCDATWMGDTEPLPISSPTPIFVVGLPRTGTTLVDRIISSHSQVESADESFFLQMAVQKAGQQISPAAPDAAVLAKAAQSNCPDIMQDYLRRVSYRLNGQKYFVEKYPFNFLYLGFIAKAMPQAKIVLLQRHPLDACFAMFKQPYFKFAYQFGDLADYYHAWTKLVQHWQALLPGLVVLEYEALVRSPEAQIKALLASLELGFEPACLNFHRNSAASATASSVQIREPVHTRSVGKWRQFEAQLTPLTDALVQRGITIPGN